MRYVVTLVHGTWASGIFRRRRASWVRYGSKLCKSLRARFGHDVRITRLVWSGSNNVTARRKAAVRLQRHLRRERRRDPDAYHFVIAHSHGGNVVFRALRRPNTQQRIAGVACLSTPFLLAHERFLGPKGSKSVLSAILFLAMIASITASWPPETLTDRVAFGVWLLISVLLIKFVWPRWERFAHKVRRWLAIGEVEREKVLLMRMSGDEATAALGGTNLLPILTTRMYARAAFAQHRAQEAYEHYQRSSRGRLLEWILTVIVLIGNVIGMFADVVPLPDLALDTVYVPDWIKLAALPVLSILIVFLAWESRYLYRWLISSFFLLFLLAIAAAVLSLFMLPFGRELAMANVFLDISAETSPLGKYALNHLTAGAKTGIGGWLVHSEIYEDERAIKMLLEWLEARIGPPLRAH